MRTVPLVSVADVSTPPANTATLNNTDKRTQHKTV